MGYRWKGKRVRHVDGREGVIEREDADMPLLTLHITCDDGTKDAVILNARGPDAGAGWRWWRPNFGHLGDAWLPLGSLGGPAVYEVDASTARAAGLDASEAIGHSMATDKKTARRSGP